MKRRPQRQQQRGAALVVVLWLSTLLGVMLGSFTLLVRNEINLARNQIDIAEARAAAAAGVQLAAFQLIASPPDSAPAADGTPWNARFGEAELRIAIINEGGKIDLNRAPRELLAALFRLASGDVRRAEQLADAVLDWRDRDDLRHIAGAEADDYRAAGIPGPGNREFRDVAELAGVLGMDPALYTRLADVMTVHSRQNQVASSFAPALVRQALELQLQDENASRPRRGRSSNLYTIHVQARVAEGVQARVAALLRLGSRRGRSDAFTVLSWAEDSRLFGDGAASQ